MTEFRLTQISDTHLSRAARFARLTENFHRVSEHIDANRPDLVINSGDVAWDAPGNRADLEYGKELHAALPVDCRYLPGNHDVGDNPTAVGKTPAHPATEKLRDAFVAVFGEDRWQFEAAGWRFIGLNSLIMNTGIRERSRADGLVRLTACRRERQADRAVPAQAAVPGNAEDPEAPRYRDPLCAAAGARAAGRDARRSTTCGSSPAAMCISAATSPMAACATSGRRQSDSPCRSESSR